MSIMSDYYISVCNRIAENKINQAKDIMRQIGMDEDAIDKLVTDIRKQQRDAYIVRTRLIHTDPRRFR